MNKSKHWKLISESGGGKSFGLNCTIVDPSTFGNADNKIGRVLNHTPLSLSRVLI